MTMLPLAHSGRSGSEHLATWAYVGRPSENLAQATRTPPKIVMAALLRPSQQVVPPPRSPFPCPALRGYTAGKAGRREGAVDAHVKLIVGCVVFVPVIVLFLAASWKQWRGKWLGFSDFTFNSYEGRPASLLQRRRGRRSALVGLVWAVACAGILGISAFSAASGFPANLESVSGIALPLAIAAGCAWTGAGSRRDRKAVENGAELAEEYALDTRKVVFLVLAMLAVLAVEIGSSLIAPW